MTTHVLIIDPNEAFATLLKEGLEADSEYQTTTASDGQAAFAALKANTYDLLILDLGLDDPEPAALLREIPSELSVIVIPVEGSTIPQELIPFDIQGVITKPFFMPELPARIAAALGRTPPDRSNTAPTPTSSETLTLKKPAALVLPKITLKKDDTRVSETLQELADALNAEGVLLIGSEALLDHAGQLIRSDIETLAKNILQARNAATESSWVNTKEQVQFGTPVLDNEDYLLYSLNVAQDMILSVVIRPDTSLRTIRTHCRQAAETLVQLGNPQKPPTSS